MANQSVLVKAEKVLKVIKETVDAGVDVVEMQEAVVLFDPMIIEAPLAVASFDLQKAVEMAINVSLVMNNELT